MDKMKNINFKEKTYVMGILNITPNSFSDGGKYLGIDAAVERAKEMIREGADIIDIGAQSTKPGAEEVSAEEELNRLKPVIEELVKLDTIISVDTDKSIVAEEVLKMGVHIINDISGLKYDKNMAFVVAKYDALLVAMHMQGRPQYMQENPEYEDLIREIKLELLESVELAKNAGVKKERIILDPGIGFGKTTEDNLLILKKTKDFVNLDYPLLIGASRKSVIGNVLDVGINDRLEGSLAVAVYTASKGANIIRVHDVKETVRALKMFDAINSVKEN